MHEIQAYWGGIGRINRYGKGVVFSVTSKENLSVILAHFDSYPLITQKKGDYELFKRAVLLINNKEYYNTPNGIQEIINIRASLNLGLSPVLKEAFPQTIPYPKPLIKNQKIPHPDWIAGFTSGEGCFSVKIRKGSTKIGFRVELAFILTQHIRDKELLKSLVAYFDCGGYYFQDNKDYGQFRSDKFQDLYEKILPFFQKHGIRGVKALDFKDWCEVVGLIKSKAHLNSEGLACIQKIKENMNRSRTGDLT